MNYSDKLQSILQGQRFQTIRGGFTYSVKRDPDMGPLINSVYSDGRVIRAEGWLNEHRSRGGMLAVDICSMGKSATVYFDVETDITLL